MKKITPTLEICLAILSEKSKGDASLMRDPRSYLSDYFGVDVPPEISLSVVQNDHGSANLLLPYYAALENVHAAGLEDTDINDVSGGEIFFTVIFSGSISDIAKLLAARVADSDEISSDDS